MEASKSKINFQTLSAELRNKIYELALTPTKEGEGGIKYRTAILIGPRYLPDTACEPCAKKDYDPVKGRYGDKHYVWHTWAKQPALTKVSRKLRQETLPIYYGANEFVTYTKAMFDYACGFDAVGRVKISYPWIEKWLKAIGPNNMRLLKNVAVLFDCNERVEGYGERKSLVDYAPKKRFVRMLAREGIELAESCVAAYWVNHPDFTPPECHTMWIPVVIVEDVVDDGELDVVNFTETDE